MMAIKVAIYISIASIMTWGLISVDAFEAIYIATREHEDWDLDEIILAGTAVTITGTLWLSIELGETKLTKAREAEAEIRDRFDAVTQSVPLPIFITGRDSGEIEYINQPGKRLLDCTTCEPADIAKIRLFSDKEVYRNILEHLDRDGLVENHEFQFRTVGGTAVSTLLYCREISVNGDSSLVTVIVDLSELFASQAQLVHASKLATLGEMAAGIAHELNQPLNNIRMSSEILGEYLEEGDPLPDSERLLENITSQIDRAAAIIDHMRMFARNDVSIGAINSINAIDGALSLVGKQISLMDIDIVRTEPDTVRPVMGDGLLLEQVVVNLLTNARDAIAQRDDINGKRAGQIQIEIEDNSEFDTVKIMITDDGNGIPENVLERMFEPFFTTKKIGDGTGIGLSISNGIITSMGGTITAENIEDGARLTIALPVMTNGANAQA